MPNDKFIKFDDDIRFNRYKKTFFHQSSLVIFIFITFLHFVINQTDLALEIILVENFVWGLLISDYFLFLVLLCPFQLFSSVLFLLF